MEDMIEAAENIDIIEYIFDQLAPSINLTIPRRRLRRVKRTLDSYFN